MVLRTRGESTDEEGTPRAAADGAVEGGQVEDGRDGRSRAESPVHDCEFRKNTPYLVKAPKRRLSGAIQAGPRKRLPEIKEKLPQEPIRRDPEGDLPGLGHSEGGRKPSGRQKTGQKSWPPIEDPASGGIGGKSGKSGDDFEASGKIQDRLRLGTSLEPMEPARLLRRTAGRNFGQGVGKLRGESRCVSRPKPVPDGTPV